MDRYEDTFCDIAPADKPSDPLIGKQFFRLTTIRFVRRVGSHKLYEFECTCGETKICYMNNVKRGITKSCGCLQIEGLRARTTHGRTHTRLYATWRNMKMRCTNPNTKVYKNYGGRGITVCDEWAHDFTTFEKWAVEHGYKDSLTIERIDYNKSYSPENCTWIKPGDQAKNRRGNIMITLGAETKPMREWCSLFRLPYKIVHQSMSRKGINGEAALMLYLEKYYIGEESKK